MIRFTFKYMKGKHGAVCYQCGNAPVGVQTDRKTGDEWYACKSCIKHPGFLRRGHLHPDFRKQTKLPQVLHIKKCRKPIQDETNAHQLGTLNVSDLVRGPSSNEPQDLNLSNPHKGVKE